MAKPSARPSAPIWARPAPSTRHPRLTREQIASAALAIADREGFAAVSMRRVATELDVGTMTLYYYVKTKDELIALMDDAIMAEVVLPASELPAGWRAGLTAIARRTRAVFTRHAWALSALQGARIGPSGMQHMEQSLAALADAPIDVQGKLRLLSIVDDYVFGHGLRISEALVHPMDHKVLTSITEFLVAQLATGDYPQLSAMLGGDDVISAFTRVAHWMSDDTRFEAGLTAVLDGMELQMRGAGEPSARPREVATGAGAARSVARKPRGRGGARQAPRTPR